MASEKFSLKWNDFQDNIVSSFTDLRSGVDFSDVTLVCEEDHQVEAHRTILASCSTFFSTLLKRNNHSHPMIYMRGLNAKDLESILDFIYHGEANVYQEDLSRFLCLAEELQLKGLVESHRRQNRTETSIQELKEPPIEKTIKHNQKSVIKEEFDIQPIKDFIEYSDGSIKDDLTSSAVLPIDTGKIYSTIEDLKTKTDLLAERINDGDSKWKCTVCGKLTKTKQDIGRHIETHLDGVSHTCHQCGKACRSSNALRLHISVYHPK